MKILAIGAHFDDVELGCGGTLARHRRRGDEVALVVATHSGFRDPGGRPIRSSETAHVEGRAAADILGIERVECLERATNDLRLDEDLVVSLRRVVEDFGPDVVYVHRPDDAHLDHNNLARAALSACRHVPRVLFYRSNLFDSHRPWAPCHYIDVSETLVVKEKACRAHESEMARGLDRLVEAMILQNRADGARFGRLAVEAFELLRYLD
ncbi:MAG: PIG-L family deacetylase [Planctomycetes bacterium]|nr:PIG-L family deacetylase [Planctomycetota bacterium]